MRLAIGIDTGGTCTDAVLYDFDAGRVLGQSKALTTYDDLTRGLLEALDGLDPALCRRAEIAGLSTTLATNACVEGKFRRTRLLLLGIDHRGIARFGADYGFTDPDDIRYLPCRTTITGKILEEPDWTLLRAHAKEWFEGVEGCAVCEIYGMRNGGTLETKAAAIVQEETGLPVVCASTLFGGLSSLERAASAVLNAGLLPVTRDFVGAVSAAFRARGIGAGIMIVRSDSSLMSMAYSAKHAVETLLSGPAASALGGSALTGRDHAVVVDIGGTTTDVALIDGGTPLLSEDGIRVGKWKTLVRGLFSTSFALGGDSAIRWDRFGKLSIGPDRVIPLCVLAAQYPAILPALRAQVRDVPAHTLPLHEFLTLSRPDWDALPLPFSAQERTLCRALEKTPLGVQAAADLLGIDKYQLDTHALEKAGVLLRAGGRLLCCSTAAGPAFEGAGLSCGMPAAPGAIRAVRLQNGVISCETVGEQHPTGICGSGILDALAVMLETEVLEDTGYIDEDFPIADSGVTVSQRDVREIQLAKSAICAGLMTLLEHEALSPAQIDRFSIAGGFGSSMNMDSARAIGLFPAALQEKTEFIGNGALGGASMLLMNRSLREVSEQLAQGATELSLSASAEFMDHYIDCMSFMEF